MQCPECAFENLPHVDRCGRCRAVLRLVHPISRTDLVPPRAGAMKVLRPAGYVFRRVADRLATHHLVTKVSEAVRPIFSSSVTAIPALLSVVPGLGHIADGRINRGILAFSAWFMAGMLTATFYGGLSGSLLLMGLTLIHAFVVLDAARVIENTRVLRARIRTGLAVLTVVSLGYLGLEVMARHFMSLEVIPFPVPERGLSERDTLLMRKAAYSPEAISPGDVVSVRSAGKNIVRLDTTRWFNYTYSGTRVGLVVASAGDEVELSSRGLAVNGALVRAEILEEGEVPFPVKPVSFKVPDGAVLAVGPLENIRVDSDMRRWADSPYFVASLWENMYTVDASCISGKAIAVYYPLSRRGLMKKVSIQ